MKPIRILLYLLASTLLASCGDSDLGAGMGEFKTVLVSANAPTVRLESDVLSGNTCTNGVSSGGTFSTDSLDFDISSATYPGTTGALNVKLDSIRIKYAPAKSNVYPLNDTLLSAQGQMISPGGSATIPVPVVPEILKSQLTDTGTMTPCTSAMHEYYVTVYFTLIEIGTGVTQTVPASLTVAIADRTGT